MGTRKEQGAIDGAGLGKIAEACRAAHADEQVGDVDHFLEPPPRSLSKTVIMAEGKEVSGKRVLTRYVAERARCKP